MDQFVDLPLHIHIQITQYLNIRTLRQYVRCCKAFSGLLQYVYNHRATLVLNIHNHLEAKSNLLKASVRSIRVTQPVDLNVLGDYPGLIEIDLSEDEEVVHDTNDLTVVFYLPARIHFQKIKLMYGHFHNLEMLTACVNLKVLNLRGNKLEDISELCHLHTLEELNLSRNRIRDIIALNNLKNLRALNLSGNSLRDTSPLKSLVNLQHLVLIGYETNIVADLTGLIHLHTLIINSGNLNDITELKNLQQLEYLNICGNAIQDISCLTSLKKLKYLYLFDNPINDYSPLLELHLEELIVGCGITERYPELVQFIPSSSLNYHSRCDIAF